MFFFPNHFHCLIEETLQKHPQEKQNVRSRGFVVESRCQRCQQNQDMLDDMAAKAELEHGLQSSLGLKKQLPPMGEISYLFLMLLSSWSFAVLFCLNFWKVILSYIKFLN